MCNAIGPGPGAYKLKTLTGACDHDPSKNKSPEYSFGLKSPLCKRMLVPAPYKLNDATRFGMPGNPKYTMAARYLERKESINPGPAAYNIRGCAKTPAWTIAKRVGLPLAFYSPGPASYSIPSTLSYPRYTMPSVLIPLDKSRSPGPAQYALSDLNAYKLREPIYTMRPTLPRHYDITSPGPAQYLPKICKNTPSYTFGTKHACFETLYITAADTFPCF